MPFYYRPRRSYYWNRRNWNRRARPRRRFRRRIYRRRVRQNYKLKTIKLKEWQPPTIRKCCIKGKECLVYFSPQRLHFNSVMYQDSITPDHWPGGGGFSVLKFSLASLYESHMRCRNWWTNTNEDLPLCRYLGCKMLFYQCDDIDYTVKVQNVLPAESNKYTYPSCQPSMMLMSSHKHIIPSRQNKKKRKPYYTVKIPPPSQYTNKWYFQKDLNEMPLVVLHTSVVSLNNYFVKPNELSNNCTFNILNTEAIQNRNFKNNAQSWAYKLVGGTVGYYMYWAETEPPPENGDDIQIGDLVPLTNPLTQTHGYAWNSHPFPDKPNQFSDYIKIENFKKYWGNPFDPHIIDTADQIYITTTSPEALAEKMKNKGPETKWKDIHDNRPQTLTKFGSEIVFQLQYNPNKDDGVDNYFYLLSNKEGHGWEEPLDENLVLKGFPLWIGLYGLIDWTQKIKKLVNVETDAVVVFKTKKTFRPYHFPIVPLSTSFKQGRSPYEQDSLNVDKLMWYPMTQYQVEEINKIVQTGPGTPYTTAKSENVQMFYKFYFKWGGAPAKVINVENPSNQICYPIPRNEHETTSLQNPAQAPETVLCSFDYRHGDITRPALQRISHDWSTKTIFDSITEPEKRQLLQKALQNLKESEQEEQAQEKKIQHQLKQLKLQQQYLREHIMSLLMQTQ
nr:MAG: ORF1 [TTV-like mini virus]